MESGHTYTASSKAKTFSGKDLTVEQIAASLLPKEETQAFDFITKNPTYDGRGVIVAIFDSGVDPGAPGLQITSDGKPKIIDLIDATGSGDVDCSTIREATPEGQLQGLSGRTLTLGKWTNRDGLQYRVGIKRGYELFPKPLVDRLKTERKKAFDIEQRNAIFSLKSRIDSSKDFETQFDQLKDLEKKYSDHGPVYDCVVFHDGQVWRVAIDTCETGDLTRVPLLTDYKKELQYSTFSNQDLLNFSVNIFDNGNTVSIVTSAGTHGTHVAGIVGAYYKDQPELNGVAPGVQLVGVKIGDTRLGTMETGPGMIRGLISALQCKVDMINMSYGEPTSDPKSGRFPELAMELVNKHKIIFVSSAGNNGPALTTTGAPGGTTPGLIGVGAYVSPGMMLAEYSLREELPEIQYTWSSRGPTADGALGVSISAPGGAIAPVANYTLQRNQLMNGTSMSSPNCCGCIALLLSGLKQKGVFYTPTSVRRAIENTARPLENVEVFAQGSGVIQVEKSFSYLETVQVTDDVRFEVSTVGKCDRGIYLREYEETRKVVDISVNVKTVFHNDTDNKIKVEFEKRISLHSTQSWIQVPKFLQTANEERAFSVRVDPRHLKEGEVHYGEVIGTDSKSPDAGPLFKFPVTVLRTVRLHDENTINFENVDFKPGQIRRNFVEVPTGASYAELVLKGVNVDTTRRFVFHSLQLIPWKSIRKTEYQKYFAVNGNDSFTTRIPVVPGVAMEITLAQFWSSLGSSTVDYSLTFFGMQPDCTRFALTTEALLRIDFKSCLRNDDITPSVTLNKLQQTLRPSSFKLSILKDQRDLLPEGRAIYEGILTYQFKLDAGASVRPKFPIISTILYESAHEGQFYMIYDSNKQLLASGDAWPKFVKLSKGDFTIRYQLRHDRSDLIEKLKDAPITLEKKLEKSVTLNVYADPNAAVTDGTKYGTKKVALGRKACMYVKKPDDDSLPKDAKAGDVLVGSFNFYKSPSEKDKKIPGYPFSYLVPPKSTSSSSDSKSSDDETSFEVLLLEQKVSLLQRLMNDKKRKEEFLAVLKEVLASNPKYLPALDVQLRYLDASEPKNNEEVVAAANKVIENIDTTALAVFSAMKVVDSEDAAYQKEKKEMDKTKGFLLNALHLKAVAQLDLGYDEKAEAAYKELKRWTDTDDAKYVQLEINYLKAKGQAGAALKVVLKSIESNSGTSNEKKFYDLAIQLLEQLGWAHWVKYYKTWSMIRFPQAYQPF